MHRIARIARSVVPTALLALALPALTAAQPATGFTTDFALEECTFSNEDRNPYFSLEPGDRLVLEGDDDGETVRVRITALNATRTVRVTTPTGVPLRVVTRVIEEREWIDDELVEVSRNYYARCEETSDVVYFGEDVDIYEDGVVVSHDGAWLAGKNGAQPGIIMPGRYLLGARYFQEIAPGVALDRAKHTAMRLDIDTPAGSFENCVEVIETTPLEPGHESRKVYCPGIGLVVDSVAELVDFDLEEEDDD